MATWEDVRRIALALSETTEGEGRGLRRWQVKDKLFAPRRRVRALLLTGVS